MDTLQSAKQIIANQEQKLPPQNIQAEQSLLGAVLIDKNALIKIADALFPNDFYKQNHGFIFQAILDLYSQGEPVDILSLSNKLKQVKKLAAIGNISYLTELAGSVPSSANALHYAKIIRQKSVLRSLISVSEEIATLSYQEDSNTEDLLDMAEQKIFAISQHSLQQDFMPLKASLTQAFDRLERLQEGEQSLRGLSTGFLDLDSHLAGLQKADLIILAARPSLGKTSLALDIARYAACQKKAVVGIFSLEMSKEQLVDRLLCAQAGVDFWKMRTGHLSTNEQDSDFTRLQQAMAQLSEACLFIDDSAMSNVMQMRTMARRLQAKQGLDLIVVDYLQLIMPRYDRDNLVQQVTEISRSLKAMSRELNVPVLALSQLSRAVESRSPQRPRLSDLRESGSLEQDADVVLFIYREDREKPNTEKKNIAEIIIAKHRNGPIGKIDLYFNENQASFKNLETHYS